MFASTIDVTLDLVPHCASTPRESWGSTHDLRPLSDVGFQQAANLAGHLGTPIHAVYSSPALRCIQSVAPLAEAAGVSVVTMEGLREAAGFADPTEWVSGPFAPIGASIGGAWTAGRAAGVIFRLAARHSGQHVVLCSHGDTLPAVLSYLAAAHDCPLPALVPRGGWHRLWVRGGALSITSHEPDTGRTPPRTVFVSGHVDLTEAEFALHYAPELDRLVAEGARFVVGDSRGADALAQGHLHHRSATRRAQGLPPVAWRVFHMFTEPRHNVGSAPKEGGFTSDDTRDAAMTAASDQDLAWVRPGRERSGTAKNLLRRRPR